MKSVVRILGIGVVLVLVALPFILWRKGAPPLVPEVTAVQAATVPLDPNDPAWDDAPMHVAKMIPQDLVEPRQMAATTPEVQVQAITNGVEVAFRLTWADSVKNDLPGAARFPDGCAVQIPTKIETDVPDPQMGGRGRPVEITFWRADWQASVDGRGDTIRDLYPNASVDHYPAEAPPLKKGSPEQTEAAARYNPARALGNRRAGPRDVPVEDLIAEGPGTITPAPAAGSKGRGVWSQTGWSVVIVRKMPAGLAPRVRTNIAFAVWEGGKQEVGARKMRTGWVPLLMKG